MMQEGRRDRRRRSSAGLVVARRPGLAAAACNLLLAILLVLALALGALAWRLAEGPLEIPFLARQIEASVNAATDGPRLAIGRAAVAWEGFRGGTAAPLDIRLSDVRLRGADGGARAELPDAAATLSFRALLRGTLAPATIELRQPRMVAQLAADGSLALEPRPRRRRRSARRATPMPTRSPCWPTLMRAGLRARAAPPRCAGCASPAANCAGRTPPPAGAGRCTSRRSTSAAPRPAGWSARERRSSVPPAPAMPVRLNGSADGTPMRIDRRDEPAGASPDRARHGLAAARPAGGAGCAGQPLRHRRARCGGPAGPGPHPPHGRGRRLRPGPRARPRPAGAAPRRLPFAGLAIAADITGRALALRQARLVLPGAGRPAGPGAGGDRRDPPPR